jgi:hypothetical protein
MTDLFDGEPVPLGEQLLEAERELHLRLSVYPRRVSSGKLTQAQADRNIRVQRAIIATLRGLQEGNQ